MFAARARSRPASVSIPDASATADTTHPQLGGQLLQQPVNPVLLNFSQGDLVDTRSTAIAIRRHPRALQNVPAKDLVPQRVKPSPGISLAPPGTAHAAKHEPDPRENFPRQRD